MFKRPPSPRPPSTQANLLCIPPSSGGDTCGVVQFQGIRIVPHTPILGKATGSMPVWKGNSIVYVGYDRNNVPTGMAEVPLDASGYSMERMSNLNPVVRANAASTLTEAVAQSLMPPVYAPEVIARVTEGSRTAPAAPLGLKYCTPTGSSLGCPAMSCYGMLLVPFSFVDNRFASRLVGFDSTGKSNYSFERPGLRYIDNISVNEQAKVGTFRGQDGQSVVMSFYDLPFSAPLPGR